MTVQDRTGGQKMKNNLEKTYRYSLRKLKMGSASVAVASMVWLNQGATQ